MENVQLLTLVVMSHSFHLEVLGSNPTSSLYAYVSFITLHVFMSCGMWGLRLSLLSFVSFNHLTCVSCVVSLSVQAPLLGYHRKKDWGFLSLFRPSDQR